LGAGRNEMKKVLFLVNHPEEFNLQELAQKHLPDAEIEVVTSLPESCGET
jgi:hypothetical protein